jgi:hypothetical protein
MPEGTLIRWSAYEHEHVERENDWFWALGIIAVCAALTSILFSNVLFAILILLAAFVIALIARTPPELHEITLSERGIRIGETLHRFDEILAFWVDTESTEPRLLIDTTKVLSPNIVIPLSGVDGAQVRAFLLEHAEEREMHELFSHRLLEALGF